MHGAVWLLHVNQPPSGHEFTMPMHAAVGLLQVPKQPSGHEFLYGGFRGAVMALCAGSLLGL
jgi:hypothetical protein